ncbi:MAG TPA: YceI family protein [Chitinophagales bacterium]|nr:YceI family protein [Chitinophagales bacterium]
MKKLTIFILVALVFSMVACTQAPDAPKATVSEPQATNPDTNSGAQGNWKVDLQQSKVAWVGTKPTGRHNGAFNLKDGALSVANGQITGGSFTIDLPSIAVLDEGMSEDSRTDLTEHLKSADFFEVSKFPEGKFEITSVQPAPADAQATGNAPAPTHILSGNLTLKGVTKGVTFPATIAMSENMLKANANFNIDRTNWGMSYKSDKSLGDKIIHPEVNIGITLVANSN